MRNVPSLETVYRDYSKKGVKFFYIYKSLAHPGRDGLVQPFTIEERLAHVKAAKAQLETEMPWIADSMTNELKHAFGDRNNSEFVIDPKGKLVHARAWSDPAQLRTDLAKLVGEVEKPTTIADLKLTNPRAKKRPAASGVVERVPALEGGLALKQTPKMDSEDKMPFYAKLRMEVERSVINDGSGKIHVGFHLDPVYKEVHWNNLAKPLEFELKAPSGKIVPDRGVAPKVEEEFDVDPREFLIEVSDLDTSKPLELTVRYFACNDSEGWCKPVTQSYTIQLEQDRDAGRVTSPRGGGARGGAAGRGRTRGGAGTGRMAEMLKQADADGDGRITREEFRGPDRMFERLDSDKNGELSKEETAAAATRFGGGQRGRNGER